MLRADLNTIAAMSDAQIAPLTCVNLVDVQAMLAQKDAANGQLAAANAAAQTANRAIAAALAALNAALKPVVSYTDLPTATAAVAPALASEAQQAVAANQTIVTLQGQLTRANAQIATLQATVAGTSGNYQLSLTKAQEIAVEKEATKQGTTPAAIVALLAIPPFTALAGTHTPDILATGLANYEAMTAAQQNAILTAFGPPLNALVNM